MTSRCSSNIGFVFQSYALFKSMSVFKNIAFGLKIKKWKKADIEARGGTHHAVRFERTGETLSAPAPADNASGWPSPGRWRLPRSFCSMNRSGAVDAKIRRELREWLVTLHHLPERDDDFSRMIRRRRWRFPIAS